MNNARISRYNFLMLRILKITRDERCLEIVNIFCIRIIPLVLSVFRKPDLCVRAEKNVSKDSSEYKLVRVV